MCCFKLTIGWVITWSQIDSTGLSIQATNHITRNSHKLKPSTFTCAVPSAFGYYTVCQTKNEMVAHISHSVVSSFPIQADAVLMATVRQSSVTHTKTAKDRHYLRKDKKFKGGNRFQSSFAREDTFGSCQQPMRFRCFNFGSWRYFGDKRRKVFCCGTQRHMARCFREVCID